MFRRRRNTEGLFFCKLEKNGIREVRRRQELCGIIPDIHKQTVTIPKSFENPSKEFDPYAVAMVIWKTGIPFAMLLFTSDRFNSAPNKYKSAVNTRGIECHLAVHTVPQFAWEMILSGTLN